MQPTTVASSQARPSWWLKRNPLARLPIAAQLTLGFLIAALLAAGGASVTGLQRAQTLQVQAAFYQTLLGQSAQLSVATQELHNIQGDVQYLAINPTTGQQYAGEDIAPHVLDLHTTAPQFDAFIHTYLAQDEFIQDDNLRTQLAAVGLASKATEQQVEAQDVAHAWVITYGLTQQLVAPLGTAVAPDGSQRVTPYPLPDATIAFATNRVTPAVQDAISALDALSQTITQIASVVSQHSAATAAAQSQSEFVTTIIVTIVAVVGIAAIGWFFAYSMGRRLSELRRVSRAVEDGEFEVRAVVGGRDEIARAGLSMNQMLDTIVGLLNETRHQRDALTGAAERLFADMRMAGAGDLRVNAAVTDDPVGLLGNAFNLTIGRFRRFILRTSTAIEQLEVIARRENQRSQNFAALLRRMDGPMPSSGSSSDIWPLPGNTHGDAPGSLMQVQGMLRRLAAEGAVAQMRGVLEQAEEIYLALTRLRQLVAALPEARNSATVTRLAQLQMQEVQHLDGALRRLGNIASVAQQNDTAALRALEVALTRIAQSPTGLTPLPAPGSPSSPLAPALAQTTFQFSDEMAGLARELLSVVHEMHTSIAPFRLEGNVNYVEGGMPEQYTFSTR